MLSLELAKKLKDAGLKWEPKLCTIPEWQRLLAEKLGTIYIPSLSELLAEIEGLGYGWELRAVIDESQSVDFCPKIISYWIRVTSLKTDKYKTVLADTPDDAAAEALLWILEREKDG